MAAKGIFFICASFLLVQIISGLYIPDAYGFEYSSPFAAPFGAAPWREPLLAARPYANPLNYGLSPASFAASRGGLLEVFSSSPIPASGVSVYSENAIEGALAVAGELPFLGTVEVAGPLATYGAGSVAYGCGNGNVAITKEGPYGFY